MPLLNPVDRAMLAKVGRGCRAAVVASGLPRATGRVRLRLQGFLGSVERLSWARANGFKWNEFTSALVAAGGHLEVLKWARENQCPWDQDTCAYAALRGHLEVLKWARQHDCPWGEQTCAVAAYCRHLEVLRWAVENHCPGAVRYARFLNE